MKHLLGPLAERYRRAARAAWRAGLDFVYPRVCPRCGREDDRIVSAADLEPVFCRRCCDELAPEIPHACQRCAAPVGPFLETSSGCIHCRGERFAFGSVIRLGVYEGGLRSLCLLGKHPGSEPLVAAAALLLWEREHERLKQTQTDLAVPVPHHWLQRMRRSFNSAELAAGLLARRLGIDLEGRLVRKIRCTPPQAGLPATQRRTNLRGAFGVPRGCDLNGCRVLVIDDVLTTGSTANEVAKTLRKAGAEVVAALVLARAVPK